jgi:hypothetical protein
MPYYCVMVPYLFIAYYRNPNHENWTAKICKAGRTYSTKPLYSPKFGSLTFSYNLILIICRFNQPTFYLTQPSTSLTFLMRATLSFDIQYFIRTILLFKIQASYLCSIIILNIIRYIKWSMFNGDVKWKVHN